MFGVKLQKFSSPVNPEAYERKVFPFQKAELFPSEKREPDLCQVGELQKIFIFVNH